ncbi:MAG: MFS transporter [Microthrixaceae bacterium]
MPKFPTAPASDPVITREFVTVVICGLFYFFSLGMLLPTVPLFVAGPLGGSDLAVGVLVGSFSIGAVLVRPFAGRIGDSVGRKVLIVGGASIVAVSTGFYVLVTGPELLFAARLFGGVGEAAFFVGAGTMITDLAPPARRGEAISYWSVAVYSGLAFGPALGEFILDETHFNRVWLVALGCALISAAIGLFTTETVVQSDPGGEPAPLINRSSLIPGSVLFLGMIGLAGFAAFMPLYVGDVGLEDSSSVFLLYGCTVLLVRIFGAKIPDRIGPLRAGTLSTAAVATGLVIIAILQTKFGLYFGTVVFSVGMSLLYPSVLTLALTGVPDSERGSAVGTVSSFFDLSQGIGAAVLGVSVGLGGFRAGFSVAALCALAALVLLRSGVDPRTRGPIDHAAAALAREHVEPDPA